MLLAKLEPLTDGGLRTLRLPSTALTCAPHHHETHVRLDRLHQMFVPRWHFPMLADEVRNRASAAAIAAKSRPGDVALDTGCGAGLTATLAARADAKHVYTCEQQLLIAEAAAQVIERNRLTDRISVIPKASCDLEVGRDLPERADVVVSEIVDAELLGEARSRRSSMLWRRWPRPMGVTSVNEVEIRGVAEGAIVMRPRWR